MTTRRARLWQTLAGLCLVVAACTGGDEGRRVTREELLDFEEPLPADAVGVDLGDVAPDDEIAFCDAAASTSNRWITDALYPLQFWHDTYRAVDDAPGEIEPAIERLVAFTEARLRWSLTGDGERPDLDETLTADVVALAETAVSTCPHLPLVVGLPGVSDTPIGWRDLTDDEVSASCRDTEQRVATAIDEYVATVGRQPRHQIEMEPALPLFASSDFHGVELVDGVAVVVPVPGGACDLG